MRAGSITVAELIKNRPAPVRIPSRDEAVTEELAATPLDGPRPKPSRHDTAPNTHRRAAAKTRQTAKLAGLSVATGVLCASVIAASLINTHRQASTDAAAPPAIALTDTQALLPNMFILGPDASSDRTVTGLPLPNKGAAATSIDGGPALDQPEQKKLAGTHPVAAEDPINAELVRQYYDLLASRPAQALGLLDNTVLHGSDLTGFVNSWSQVRNIQVLDVQQRPDGLLAVVETVMPDGGTARVQQLLKVTNTTPQRITGAEIISAQRS